MPDLAVKPLVCREWQEIRVGENGLTETEAVRFHALAEQAGRRLKRGETGVLVRTRRSLKAQQVVGVLAVPGRTLEILPKIDGEHDAVRNALVRMLAVAHRLAGGRRRACRHSAADARPPGTPDSPVRGPIASRRAARPAPPLYRLRGRPEAVARTP